MIRPLLDVVLVEIEHLEEVSAGGIVLAKKTVDQDKVSAQRGIVKALGPDIDLETSGLAIGDKVIFPKFSGMSVDGDEKEKAYRLILIDDIKAIIDETKEV